MYSESEFAEFLDVLREWIKDQFKYWRSFSVSVVKVGDATKKGFVGLKCPQLLAKDEESYIWALPAGNPRQFIEPKVGDKGTLFFKDGDPEQARFLADPPVGMVEEVEEQRKFVIIDTPNINSLIGVDEDGGFTIDSRSEAGKGSEVTPSVLGMRLKELLDKILDDYVTDLYTQVEDLAQIVEDLNKHIAILKPGPFAAWNVKIGQYKSDVASQKSRIPGTKSFYAKPGNLLSHTNKNN